MIFGRIRRRLGVSMFILKLSIGFQLRFSPEGLLSKPVTCEGWKQLALALLTLWLCMRLNIATFHFIFFQLTKSRFSQLQMKNQDDLKGLHIASQAPVSFLRFLLPGENELSAEQLLDATSNAHLVH